MNCGIYEIVNKVNGHKYVGSSTNIQKRWKQHINALKRKDHHNKYLQRAWNKYGKKTFIFRVLVYLEPKETVRIENLLLSLGKYEYNIATDATKPLLGKSFSKEHRKSLSNSLTGRNLSESHKQHISKVTSGKKHPMWGKHHTKEAKQKISRANKGRRHTKEEIYKMKKNHKDNSKSKNPQWIPLDMEKLYSLREKGFSYRKISRIVGVSYGTIRRRLTSN